MFNYITKLLHVYFNKNNYMKYGFIYFNGKLNDMYIL